MSSVDSGVHRRPADVTHVEITDAEAAGW